MNSRWFLLCLAWAFSLQSLVAFAVEPTVQVLSSGKNTATLLVKSGEITETVTVTAGQTVTVAKQTISVAFASPDKVVLSVNGTATTLSAGAGAIASGSLLTVTPMAAGAAVAAGTLAATSQGSSSPSHSATTHH